MHWVIIAVHRPSLVVVSRGFSSLQCAGSSKWWRMLWNTSSRGTGFSSCSQLIFDKNPKPLNWQITASLTNGVRQLDIHLEGKIEPYIVPHAKKKKKNTSKCIKDLIKRYKTLKVVEESIEVNLNKDLLYSKGNSAQYYATI